MKDKLKALQGDIYTDKGVYLGQMWGQNSSVDQDTELAEQLVSRNNSHDALVEALEAAGRYHQGFNEEIGLKIRAVLASIKEAK